MLDGGGGGEEARWYGFGLIGGAMYGVLGFWVLYPQVITDSP